MQVPFGEWLPDQPEHNNPGANVANNVYFARQSYKRFPSLVIIHQIILLLIVEVQVHLEIIQIQFLILFLQTQIYIN